MRAASSRHRAAVLLLLLGTAPALACGGSSPTTPPPPPPPPRVTFVALGNPGTDAIGLALSSSTATELTLTLNAVAVADLYGYGVDITFDPAAIMFEGAEAGSFLGGEGINVNTQVLEEPDGTLIIGQTRVGDVAGVSGDGTLLTLNFTSVAAGSTTLATANAGAFDSMGAAMDTVFFGGRATVPAQTSR